MALSLAAVIIIHATSFDKLRNLQAPLTSLDVAAHVVYRVSKSGLWLVAMAFSPTDDNNVELRRLLLDEIARLEQDYNTLLMVGVSTCRCDGCWLFLTL